MIRNISVAATLALSMGVVSANDVAGVPDRVRVVNDIAGPDTSVVRGGAQFVGEVNVCGGPWWQMDSINPMFPEWAATLRMPVYLEIVGTGVCDMYGVEGVAYFDIVNVPE